MTEQELQKLIADLRLPQKGFMDEQGRCFITRPANETSSKAADELETNLAQIKQLASALNAAVQITDKLLDEVLRLHKSSGEILPLDLLSAKHAFDTAMKDILK